MVFAADRRCANRKAPLSSASKAPMPRSIVLIPGSERGPLRSRPASGRDQGSDVMAVVVGAGPRPANQQAVDAGRAPQFEIRKIEVADVIVDPIRGERVFGRAPRKRMVFASR